MPLTDIRPAPSSIRGTCGHSDADQRTGTSTRECGMRCDHPSPGRLGGLLLAAAVGMLWSRHRVPGRPRHHEERPGLRQPGDARQGQFAGLHLGRPEAGRGARLEGREDGPGQRLPDRRAVPVDPADRGARRLDAQGSPQRGGRAVGRPRPPDVPLPRLEGRTGRSAWSRRSSRSGRTSSGIAGSTGSGWASSRPARCRTRW